MDIMVEHHPDEAQLEKMGVFKWPVWQKEASTFPWTYYEEETSYILEGKAVVTPEGGPPVEIGAGDLVTFGADLRCMWHIVEPIRKHYRV
jgi:uncharacterized cupin superfamily protein